MKKTLFACCAAGLILVAASANATDVKFSGSLGAYSSYIWRGYKLSPDAVQIQPSATLSASGFSANVWADYDTDAKDLLEVDYTASYAFSLDTVSLEMGVLHYDVRDGQDSDELYVAADFDGFLHPSITTYVDVNAGDGAFVVAGISHPVEIGARATVEFAGTVSFVAGDTYVAVDADGKGFTGFFNSEISAVGSVALSDRVALEPMMGYTFALTGDASDAIEAGSTDRDDSFLYGAVSLSVSF